MQYVVILLALLALGVGYYIAQKKKTSSSSNPLRTTSSNVISMDSHRKAKQSPGGLTLLFLQEEEWKVDLLCSRQRNRGRLV